MIAGTVAAVQEAMEKSLAAGAKRAIKLNVSGPFHSSLMKPAALAMEEKLKTVDLQKPFLPVLHNVDVQIHEEPDAIRDVLAAHNGSTILRRCRSVGTNESCASILSSKECTWYNGSTILRRCRAVGTSRNQ